MEENGLLKKELAISHKIVGALFTQNKFFQNKFGRISKGNPVALKPARTIIGGKIIEFLQTRSIGVHSFKDLPKDSQKVQMGKFVRKIEQQALIIAQQKQQINELQRQLGLPNLEELRKLRLGPKAPYLRKSPI